MKRNKRFLTLLLCFILILTALSGCGEKELSESKANSDKVTSSEDTASSKPTDSDSSSSSAEMRLEYDDSYIIEEYEDAATVWLYALNNDEDDEFLFSRLTFVHNKLCEPDEHVNALIARGVSIEQFGTKVQAEIMSGKGPDMILTGKSNMFSDVNKAILAGAFQSWDDAIAEWDKDEYFEQIAHGGYSPDGKTYLLPLSIVPTYVVTTKSNMKRFGFTEEDFSDFNKTTDTLLRLWKQVEKDERVAVNMTSPNLGLQIASLYDYDSGKTTLMEDDTQQLLQKWKTIMAYQGQRSDPYADWIETVTKANDPFAEVNYKYSVYDFDTDILDEEAEFGKNYGLRHIVEFMTEEDMENMFKVYEDYTDERKAEITKDQEEIVFFPLCDTEGKISGRISSYALLSANCKKVKAATSFLKRMVFLDGQDGEQGKYIDNFQRNIHLGKYSTEKKIWPDFNEALRAEYHERIVSQLDAKEMNLILWNDALEEYNTQMMENLESDNPDWKDLETDINIYLSE